MGSQFVTGLDGQNEPTIWLARGDSDQRPMPIFRKCDLNPNARHLWPTIARALLETELPDA